MTTTNSYDYLNRLISSSSQPSVSGLAPFTFDDIGNRSYIVVTN